MLSTTARLMLVQTPVGVYYLATSASHEKKSGVASAAVIGYTFRFTDQCHMQRNLMFCGKNVTPPQQEMDDKVISPEKAEEAKLKTRYPNLGAKPGGSDLLRKRLQKGVCF